MPKFSKESIEKLATAGVGFQLLMHEVIKIFDCKVLEANRGEARQNAAFDAGFSKVRYPNSKHNSMPSRALDSAPYPVRFITKAELLKEIPGGAANDHLLGMINDLLRWYHYAGILKGIAHMQGFPIRWGGDWDGDNNFIDQDFDDLPHIEEA